MSEVLASSGSGDRPAERSDSFIDDDADFVKLFVGQASKGFSNFSALRKASCEINSNSSLPRFLYDNADSKRYERRTVASFFFRIRTCGRTYSYKR
jgi:hypothetical protein